MITLTGGKKVAKKKATPKAEKPEVKKKVKEQK